MAITVLFSLFNSTSNDDYNDDCEISSFLSCASSFLWEIESKSTVTVNTDLKI